MVTLAEEEEESTIWRKNKCHRFHHPPPYIPVDAPQTSSWHSTHLRKV